MKAIVLFLGILAVVLTGLFINQFAQFVRYKECLNTPMNELSQWCTEEMQKQ